VLLAVPRYCSTLGSLPLLHLPLLMSGTARSAGGCGGLGRGRGGGEGLGLGLGGEGGGGEGSGADKERGEGGGGAPPLPPPLALPPVSARATDSVNGAGKVSQPWGAIR
jgi:hypothetical protein